MQFGLIHHGLTEIEQAGAHEDQKFLQKKSPCNHNTQISKRVAALWLVPLEPLPRNTPGQP